jgi:predicted regulator of Ras-like GTPase activity (Roadblock/LC7/MglB family)
MTVIAPAAALPEPLLSHIRHEVEHLLHAVDGARLVVVSTVDGLDVAHATRGGPAAARAAAMTSSMAALGQVAAQEGGLGVPRCVIVEADAGYVVVRPVLCRKHPLVISLVADRSGLLGLALKQMARSQQQLELA